MTALEALVNQGHEKAAAMEMINEIRDLIMEGMDPEDVLYYYGLEPDYIMEFLNCGKRNELKGKA